MVEKSNFGKTSGVVVSLYVKLSRFFTPLQALKGAKATDVWVVHGGLGAWDPKLLRPFNDWEMDVIQAFIVLTSNSAIAPLIKNKLIWMGDVSSCFTIKANFNHLEGVSPFSVPTKCFRIPYVPSKFGFFCLGGLVGQDPHCILLKEKGFSTSKQMPGLWEEGRRAGAYSDPLSFNLGSVD